MHRNYSLVLRNYILVTTNARKFAGWSCNAYRVLRYFEIFFQHLERWWWWKTRYYIEYSSPQLKLLFTANCLWNILSEDVCCPASCDVSTLTPISAFNQQVPGEFCKSKMSNHPWKYSHPLQVLCSKTSSGIFNTQRQRCAIQDQMLDRKSSIIHCLMFCNSHMNQANDI